ncbi:alpha-D-ribose 1-methylphosphonate 5-triphosphate diphosphatase [Limnohabitans sp. Rim8]|uniref:alpha-D-ribose 1-methylphosphonate 5-triphosphate diphosphatase n=1 Tax=Limnohabitans sp. Rim8 TaxID=1100718 RepID=UPI0025EC52F1|nr:alpha-D-ribose 1-methylphosphonate 5-triphosphate diphosphatase [Limnohabitans sp. Rim8]
MNCTTTSPLVFKNAQLVLGNEVVHGCLAFQNGLIQHLDQGSSSVTQALDLEGDFLIPGLVEVHTDNFERHMMPRPKVRWDDAPAILAHDAEIAAAGITTVLDALGVGETDPDSVRGSEWDSVLSCLSDFVNRGALRADHFLHVRCELPAPNTLDLFSPFTGHPLVKMISLMDHTPGQRQWENLEHAWIYFSGKKGWTQKKFDERVAMAQIAQARYVQPHRAFFTAYCHEHQIALASHDDTTVAHVEQAFAEGAKVSEFPTTVVAAQAAKARNMLTIMGGPNVVRGGSHSGNVSATELANLGLVDILSSDYVPGSLLSAVVRLTETTHLSLPQAVALVTRNPAKSIGLHDRGMLEPNCRADFVQVRMMNLPNGRHQPIVRAVWREGVRVV